MRCKTCDYRLWNLTARQCPECGAAFAPSNFEFKPNSVKFCCPHCDQHYYGHGPKGHLVPDKFECVKCGRFIVMDEMILRPGDHVSEAETEATYNPWLERQRIGWWKGLFFTIGKGMGTPAPLMRGTPESSPTGSAWWFAFVVNLLYSIPSLLCCGGMFLLPLMAAPNQGGGPGPLAVAGMVGGAAVTLILGPLLVLLIWGALAHAMLRLTGTTESGIGRTYQVFCYTSGANVSGIVAAVMSCFGVVAYIWWAIVAIFGLMETQKVGAGRATAASLVPLFIALLGVGGWFVWMFTTAFAGLGGPMPAGMMVNTTQMTNIGDAVIAHAKQNEGLGPMHAGELIANGKLTVNDFSLTASSSTSNTIQINGKSLTQFAQQSNEQQQADLDAAVADWPESIAAHRVGDLVFTYNNVDLTVADPDLWIVIACPRPENQLGTTVIAVTKVNGIQAQFDLDNLQDELDSQNELRAESNLPPLPHPDDLADGEAK